MTGRIALKINRAVEMCSREMVVRGGCTNCAAGQEQCLTRLENYVSQIIKEEDERMISHNCITKRPMEDFEEQTGLVLSAGGMETYNNIKSNPGISDQELAELHSTHTLGQIRATIDTLQKYYLTASYWTEEI